MKPSHARLLDAWEKSPSHKDEDGYVSPSLAAIAAARKLLARCYREPVSMVMDGDEGIAIHGPGWCLTANEDGVAEVLLWNGCDLIARLPVAAEMEIEKLTADAAGKHFQSDTITRHDATPEEIDRIIQAELKLNDDGSCRTCGGTRKKTVRDDYDTAIVWDVPCSDCGSQ